VLNAAKENVPEAIKRITGRGADYAIVAVGSTKAVQQAWESLAKGGTCVVVGLASVGERISIDPFTLVGYGNERRLVASKYGSARVFDDFPRLVDLYLAGKLQLDQLITKRYGVDEVNEAHRALAAGENARGLLVF
jgi:S-(hydroxymethyl)glutathione dehydrogenase/alcohol dehydrogenase